MKNQINSLFKDHQMILETEQVTDITMSPIGGIVYFKIQCQPGEPMNVIELATSNVRVIHIGCVDNQLQVYCSMDKNNPLFLAVVTMISFANMNEAVQYARKKGGQQVVYKVDGLYFVDSENSFSGTDRVATIDTINKTLDAHYNGH